MHKVVKGHVMIQLHDANEKEGAFYLKDAGATQRYGTVVDLPEPYERVGPASYKLGDIVMIPSIGGFQFIDEETFMVFLQSEIKVIYDNEQPGISRF